jgi:AraC-like DNA-binding protein
MKTYLRHRILNVIEVKELIALEYLDFEGKYKNYSESHDFWELCFVGSGDVTVTKDDETIMLNNGELILIPPESIHSYFSSEGNTTKAFVICFESSSSALKALGGMKFLSDEVLRSCMESVIAESSNTFRMNAEEHLEVLEEPNLGGQQAIIIQLEYLFIYLLRELSRQKNSAVVFLDGENFYSDLSKIVLRFFERHIKENLTLDDVCKRMNYSRSFLCKTFKKQTGETLMGCFARMRIEGAAKLLETTDWQVTKVASYLGFPEAKYFGALFKKYMGISPSEYRNEIKKGIKT